jgi:hypothetical protein
MKVYAALTGCVFGILSCSSFAQASSLTPTTTTLLSQNLEVQPSPPPASTQFRTYTNDTYNFSVAVPQTLYSSAAPLVGKMGQRFISSSGNFEMAVYGQSQGNWTLEQLYENTLFVYRQQGAEITFSELDGDQFVISAIDPEGVILYTKKLFHEDNLLTLGLFYEATRQSALEPVVDYISDSFQPM